MLERTQVWTLRKQLHLVIDNKDSKKENVIQRVFEADMVGFFPGYLSGATHAALACITWNSGAGLAAHIPSAECRTYGMPNVCLLTCHGNYSWLAPLPARQDLAIICRDARYSRADVQNENPLSKASLLASLALSVQDDRRSGYVRFNAFVA